jgi:hypothetical protein
MHFELQRFYYFELGLSKRKPLSGIFFVRDEKHIAVLVVSAMIARKRCYENVVTVVVKMGLKKKEK